MKLMLLAVLSLFVVSCASFSGAEREVASQDDQDKTKKTKTFKTDYERYDRR